VNFSSLFGIHLSMSKASYPRGKVILYQVKSAIADWRNDR
jgi:hypothetical protein